MICIDYMYAFVALVMKLVLILCMDLLLVILRCIMQGIAYNIELIFL